MFTKYLWIVAAVGFMTSCQPQAASNTDSDSMKKKMSPQQNSPKPANCTPEGCAPKSDCCDAKKPEVAPTEAVKSESAPKVDKI